MTFTFDEDRDARWRDSFARRITTLTQNATFDVRAAHAGTSLVTPMYPTEPSDLAVRWFEKGARSGGANGELRWQSLEPDAGDRANPAFFEPGGPEASLAGGLFHFEDHPDGGDGVMVFARSDGALYACFSGESALVPLALSFEAYIELQLALLGLAGVFETFAEVRAHGMPADSSSARYASVLAKAQKKTARKTLASARRLFGDRDLSTLERRVAALGA